MSDLFKVFKKCVAVAFGLALTATGLWAAAAEEEPAAAMEKEMVLDPTTGKVVVAPEYGGTFTWGDRHPVPHCDPYIHGLGAKGHRRRCREARHIELGSR